MTVRDISVDRLPDQELGNQHGLDHSRTGVFHKLKVGQSTGAF